MQTIIVRAKTDADSNLVVSLPTMTADTEYEIVVVMQPITETTHTDTDDVPPPGTGARLAYEAHRANIRTANPIDASKADDILNEEFADYLWNKMKPDDGDE
jgi:hypothetical protein